MSDRTDTVLEAIYDALAKWDEAERQARDLRSISKADVRRVDRFPDGTRIPAPRRGAVARYLTDAVLTALSDLEAAPRSPEPTFDPKRPWDHAYVADATDRCVTCGFTGSFAHTEAYYVRNLWPALIAASPETPDEEGSPTPIGTGDWDSGTMSEISIGTR